MNILESMKVSHHVFQICSFSQLKLEKKTWSTARSRFLEIYSCFGVMLSTAFFFQGIFIPSSYETSSTGIGRTVDFIQLIGIRIAHIVAVTESLCRRSEQQNLITKIQEIDRIFEVSLNIDVENRNFRWQTIKTGLSMFAVYLICEMFILLIMAFGPQSNELGFWILYLVPLLACGVRYFQYLQYIAIIKKRFSKLIEALKHVNLLKTGGSDKQMMFNRKIPATVKLMKNLDKFNKSMYRDGMDMANLLVIRDLYNRLWEITTLVNKCFGLSILIAIGVDFLANTSNFYWIFLNFKNNSTASDDFFNIISSIIWSLPHLFNILAIALICHKTVESTSEIAWGIHKIRIDLFNDNHNSLIEQMSLQLLHQKIQFTAFGFFKIDCSLLYTIVGATTTYLIILIQFHMSEQKETSTKAESAIAAVSEFTSALN